ncbi:MAG: hypothetical protein R3267_07535 [Paenisporosarcina sp.]|nr:hypothetical protein [Paenisporosarcina sp.]
MLTTQHHEIIKRQVQEYVDENKINLNHRLQKGTVYRMHKALAISQSDISYALSIIRKERGQGRSRKIQKTVFSDLQQVCLENRLFRSSNKETPACDKMIGSLKSFIPQGGKGLLIGTPTAFCASPNENNSLLITDNLEVATILKFTTDEPITIVVGNSVDPEKAIIKGQHWKSNTITKDANVIVDRVSQWTYANRISEMAYDGSLCKVILLTSGVWTDSETAQWKRRQKGIYLDLDFKTPSINLTKRFKNLHILALVRDDLVNFGVVYVNKGIVHKVTWKDK